MQPSSKQSWQSFLKVARLIIYHNYHKIICPHNYSGLKEELPDTYIVYFSGSRMFAATTSSQATTSELIIVDHEDNHEYAMKSVTNS